MGVYGAYLQNYRHALETVRRCSANSADFADITRCIKLRSLQGQTLSLEELLHKPVARVQQNAPVLHVSYADHWGGGGVRAVDERNVPKGLALKRSFISRSFCHVVKPAG